MMLYTNSCITAAGILASGEDYARLPAAKTAHILIFSDSHGASDAVRYIFSTIIADLCLFAGDGVSDITAMTRTSVQLPPIICIRGNCDMDQYEISQKNERTLTLKVPFYATIHVAGFRILATHGHLAEVELGRNRLALFAAENQCTIAIYGHTHRQAQEHIHNITCINGGSPLYPRGTSCGGFAMLKLDKVQQFGETTFFKLAKTSADAFCITALETQRFYAQ